MKFSVHRELYVLRAHPPAVLSFDLDSGNIRTIAVFPGVPDGIQVDYGSNSIYWTNMGAMPNTGEGFYKPDGSIERCNLDGSEPASLVANNRIVTPKQLQLDAENDLLYWCDREGMAIYRCKTNGSEVTELLRTGRYPEHMADVMRHCVGLAIDKRNDHLYWTQKGPAKGGRGRIFRMGLDFPDGADASRRDDIVLLLDNLPEPIDLELDHQHAQLYWSDRGDPACAGNSVNCADITADGLVNHRVLATGLNEGIGLALDLQQRRIFVGDLSGTLRCMSMDGGVLSVVHRFEGPITGLCFGTIPDVG